jgi:hypothetical protein
MFVYVYIYVDIIHHLPTLAAIHWQVVNELFSEMVGGGGGEAFNELFSKTFRDFLR